MAIKANSLYYLKLREQSNITWSLKRTKTRVEAIARTDPVPRSQVPDPFLGQADLETGFKKKGKSNSLV